MTSLPVTWFHVASFPVRAASGDVTSSNACVMARSSLLPPKYALSYPDTLLWYLKLGDHIHIPWKITEGRQISLPLEVYDKGIARAFNWLKCLGGIMHPKPTAGCQISTVIFRFGGEPYTYPMKNYRRKATFFGTWGLSQMYCPGL